MKKEAKLTYKITLQDTFSFANKTIMKDLTGDEAEELFFIEKNKKIITEFSNGIHSNYLIKSIAVIF